MRDGTIPQIEAAQSDKPVWTGDLNDDCTALWRGLMLRAEWMDGRNWWWAVSDMRTGHEIDSSNNRSAPVSSGMAARRDSEAAAARHLKTLRREA